MSRSAQTLHLTSVAYALGDDYYRRLTSSIDTELRPDAELIRLARDYLDALERLRVHLKKSSRDPDLSALQWSTQQYIDFISGDIRSYEALEKAHVDGTTARTRRASG